MKRTVRFCGKRIDNQEIVVGYYVRQAERKHLIFTGNVNEGPHGEDLLECYEVYSDSVRISLGNRDNNGNLVFE